MAEATHRYNLEELVQRVEKLEHDMKEVKSGSSHGGTSSNPEASSAAPKKESVTPKKG